MISKELKKLNRRELVDVIYQLKKNEEQMKEQIASLEAALQDHRINLSVAGSIAEAAMGITNVFSTAQSAADLYLREIVSMKEETKTECEKMIEEAKKKVDAILADGKKQYDVLTADCQTDNKKWEQLCDEIENLKNHQETNK
ncbi:MAG: hypothetical protein IJD37_01110 [Clostridia bacterium]|nr:hypothetical protein [Clostridia bacterium]